MSPERFELNPIARRWLRAVDRAPASAERAGPDWQTWMLRRMSRSEVLDVGGVFVDRAVLLARFACTSERCAPRPGRGHLVSCCADACVPLSLAEERRLKGVGLSLERFARRRDRRSADRSGRDFFLDREGPALARPSGRCIFSRIDRAGRIRCLLHAFAEAEGLDRGALQPLSCRLFPLIAVGLPRGRVALTLVARHTYRLISAFAPERYPCLSDGELPPLYDSMRADLEWLFGRGFALALAARARQVA